MILKNDRSEVAAASHLPSSDIVAFARPPPQQGDSATMEKERLSAIAIRQEGPEKIMASPGPLKVAEMNPSAPGIGAETRLPEPMSITETPA